MGVNGINFCVVGEFGVVEFGLSVVGVRNCIVMVVRDWWGCGGVFGMGRNWNWVLVFGGVGEVGVVEIVVGWGWVVVSCELGKGGCWFGCCGWW